MVNMLVIAAIFIVLLLVIAGFVSQQFNAAQQIKDSKRPKNLLEKMSKGIGALDTDKFRQIVMDGGPDEVGVLLEHSPGEDENSSAKDSGDVSADIALNDELAGVSGAFNLEGKDLQTIYSEYLSEKNLNPFELEPDFKLGVAYLKFSQFEKAISQFQKVANDRPEYPGLFYYLGEAYRCNGQFYEAMKAYKQSWELDSSSNTADGVQQPVHDNSSDNFEI